MQYVDNWFSNTDFIKINAWQSRQKKSMHSYYSLLLFRNYKNICSEHLQFANTFPYFLHNYVTNLENTHPILCQKYKRPPIKVLFKKSPCSFKNM